MIPPPPTISTDARTRSPLYDIASLETPFSREPISRTSHLPRHRQPTFHDILEILKSQVSVANIRLSIQSEYWGVEWAENAGQERWTGVVQKWKNASTKSELMVLWEGRTRNETRPMQTSFSICRRARPASKMNYSWPTCTRVPQSRGAFASSTGSPTLVYATGTHRQLDFHILD